MRSMNPESRDSSMCNCRSEVWSFRTMPEWRRFLIPLEQHDTNDHGQRNRRNHETRGPAHAATHPPQQRAAHHDGNDDIELHSGLGGCRNDAATSMAGISDINLAPQTLADELDADRLAAAPDHFAVSS